MYIYKSLLKFNETLRLNLYEKPLSPFFCTENFVIYQDQNLFSRNHLLYFHYVIKESVHAFSCAYIELWMHLGSLESAQEAGVALGYASSNSYASFVLSKLPKFVLCLLDARLVLAVLGFSHVVRGRCASRAFGSSLEVADKRDFLRQLS